ncbi:MAG: cyanophycinase [Bacteroidetes bacterium]|nr:cyanophycinase [Bacteroidota bacterium]
MPVGKLISIGGNEFKFQDEDEEQIIQRLDSDFFEITILERFVAECGGLDARIEVVTSASSIPFEVGESYSHAFTTIGCTNVDFMHIRSREEAQEDKYLKRISEANGVLFTGGNQARLSAFFNNTDFLRTIKQKYASENFIIAGTSAGAMAMSKEMICRGNSKRALLKGEIVMDEGFGLLDTAIIDSHFVTRGRFGRLTQAVALHPNCIGIGLGEDTGILVTNGNEFEVIGSGLVLIFDGNKIEHNNVENLPVGVPLSISNLIVHAMAKGDVYSLAERKFTAAIYVE